MIPVTTSRKSIYCVERQQRAYSAYHQEQQSQDVSPTVWFIGVGVTKEVKSHTCSDGMLYSPREGREIVNSPWPNDLPRSQYKEVVFLCCRQRTQFSSQ